MIGANIKKNMQKEDGIFKISSGLDIGNSNVFRDFYDSSKGVRIIFVIFLIFVDHSKSTQDKFVTDGIKHGYFILTLFDFALIVIL